MFRFLSSLRKLVSLAASFVILFVLTFTFSISVFAAVPDTLNYQSRLRDSAGDAVNVPTTVSFSLYDSLVGGTTLWTETYDQAAGACSQVTPDADGYFALALGSCFAFPSSLDFTNEVYLGVSIGADPEASPRVLIGAHPYARNSHRVGDFVAAAVGLLKGESTGVADALNLAFDSAVLAFEGSAWDGVASLALNMKLKNTVVDSTNYKLSVLNNTDAEVFSVDESGNTILTGALTVENADDITPVSLLKATAGRWLGMNDGTDDFGLYNSEGSPEGSVVADIGSINMDTTNGDIYIKSTDGVNTGWLALAKSTDSVWHKIATSISANNLSPVDPTINAITLENNTGGQLTMNTLVNTNDASNYAGAVFSVKGSGPDYTNNMYFGKYSDAFWVPSWAGNGVMATDQDLVIGSMGTNDATNPNLDPEIIFQVGGGYTTPNNIATLNTDGLSFNNGVRVSSFLDEDDMVSNSDVALATQQSIKTYVDSKVGTSIFDSDDDTGIQVEANPDEDMVRLSTAGTERFLIDDQGRMRLANNPAASARYSLFEVGSGSESSTFAVQADPAYGNIATFRDQDGENIFRTNGAMSGNDFDVSFGDIDDAYGAVSMNINQADSAVNIESGSLRFLANHDLGTNAVGFRSPNGVLAEQIWTLPDADGATDEALVTDGAGNLSWGTVPTNVTASNGLTKAVNDIQLGGALTQNTTIDFTNDEYELYFVSPPNNSRTTVDGWAFATTDLGTNESLSYTPVDIKFVNAAGNRAFFRNNANNVGVDSDNPLFEGLSYDVDYSANYTDRSLVDKGYVDGLFSASAGSGLTWNTVNSEIDLGGDLTGPTLINKQDNNFQLAGQGNYIVDAIGFGGTSSKMGIGGNSTNWANAYINTTDQNGNRKGLVIGINDMYFEDYDNSRGVEYKADYSANYTDRSLVDKQYVDGAISFATPDLIFKKTGNVVANNALDANITTDDFLFGSNTMDYTTEANRMFFDKSKAAFRAGQAGGTEWDSGNVGSYSAAFGRGSKASGFASFVAGQYSDATSFGSIVIGNSAHATGSSATVIGGGTASGNNSIAMGAALEARSYKEIAMGSYPSDYVAASTTAWDPADRMFSIGNGADSGSKSTAFEVLKSGKTTINAPADEALLTQQPTGADDLAIATTKYVDDNISASYLADNGIINNVGTHELGGSLNKNTNIDLNTFGLQFDSSNGYFKTTDDRTEFSYGDTYFTGEEAGFEIEAADLNSATNLYIRPDKFEFANYDVDTGLPVPTFHGVTYDTDYSANYTSRSLVDKEYVDDAIANNVVAANGLTNNAGTIELGGALTKNTTVWRNAGTQLSLSGTGSRTTMSDTQVQTYVNNAGGNNGFYISASGAGLYHGNNGTGIDTKFTLGDNSATVSSRVGFPGMEYDVDYSANYTNRSLVDKEYVDGLSTKLWDIDADTGIQVEEGADDDIIRFDTLGTERMVIDSAGQIGIGTSDPSENLTITSDTADLEFESVVQNGGTHSIYFKHGDDQATGRTAIKSTATGASSNSDLSFITNNLSRFEINATGAIKSVTEHLLAGNARLGSATNSGVKSLKFSPSEAKAAIFSVPAGSYGRADLRFTVGDNSLSAEKTENEYSMIIARDGSVGIGEAIAPDYKLEVDGEVMLQDSAVPVATAGHSGVYSNGGELYALDAAGNSTQISPHDDKTNEWIYNSKNVKTGDALRIDMEAMMKSVDEMLGGGYVFVDGKPYYGSGDRDKSVSDELKTVTVKLKSLDNMIKDLKKFMKKVVFGKLTVTGTAKFGGEVIFNKDTVGYANVRAGSTDVEVKFATKYSVLPVVTLTVMGLPIDDLDYGVMDVKKTGFKVVIDKKYDKDIQFSWHAFGGSNAKVSYSEVPSFEVVENVKGFNKDDSGNEKKVEKDNSKGVVLLNSDEKSDIEVKEKVKSKVSNFEAMNDDIMTGLDLSLLD